MVPAEQDEIVQVGGAAVGPVNAVVGVAPLGRAGAAGEGASSVADDQRGPLSGGHGAVFSADVEGHAGRVGDDAGDVGVAADPAHRLRGDRSAPTQLTRRGRRRTATRSGTTGEAGPTD